jgi:DNA-binding PucR family transcriptional regulator
VAEFLDDLLEGRTDDRRGLLARAALLGIDLGEPHHVVRLGAYKPEDAGEIPVLDRDTVHHVEQAVRARYSRSMVVPQGGDVVMLLPPGADGVRDVCTSLEHVVRPRPGTPVRLAAGLGRLCSTVGDYVDSSAEATLALDLARRRRQVGCVLTPRDLGLYGLLVRGSTRQTMQSMVERALGTLLTADAEGGPDLVNTLRMYLTNDRHLERTASALHVHPNTVRYRVNRVQELLEVNLRDPDERFLLELALRVQSALEEG